MSETFHKTAWKRLVPLYEATLGEVITDDEVYVDIHYEFAKADLSPIVYQPWFSPEPHAYANSITPCRRLNISFVRGGSPSQYIESCIRTALSLLQLGADLSPNCGSLDSRVPYDLEDSETADYELTSSTWAETSASEQRTRWQGPEEVLAWDRAGVG